ASAQRWILGADPVSPDVDDVVREGEGVALFLSGVGEDEVARPATRRSEDRVVTDGHVVGPLVDQNHLRVGRTGVIQALSHIVLYGDSLGGTARMVLVISGDIENGGDASDPVVPNRDVCDGGPRSRSRLISRSDHDGETVIVLEDVPFHEDTP